MRARNKFEFGKSSNARIETINRYLKLTLNRALRCSPIDFGIPWMGGKRTATEQYNIFLEGNSKADGHNKKSYHQKLDNEEKGIAVDVVPYIKGKGFDYTAYGRFGIIGMLMLEAWEELQDEGLIPRDLYLHWGGFWTKKKANSLGWDMAHYEIRNHPQIEKL